MLKLQRCGGTRRQDKEQTVTETVSMPILFSADESLLLRVDLVPYLELDMQYAVIIQPHLSHIWREWKDPDLTQFHPRLVLFFTLIFNFFCEAATSVNLFQALIKFNVFE